MRVTSLLALVILVVATTPAPANRVLQLALPTEPAENPRQPVGGPSGPPIGLGVFEPDPEYYEDLLDFPSSWELQE